MRIDALTVTSFKNIREAELEFSPKVNCLVGDNGMGKSNLLDAVYYLSYCKSYTGVPDNMVVTHGEDVMFLSGSYTRKENPEKISAAVRPGERKIFRRGGKEYPRLSDHLGLLPIVLVSPWDNDLLDGYSETRRRFMDMSFAQGDAVYMDSLIRYRHALEQRNKMLRDSIMDAALYEAVESQMALYGKRLIDKRRDKVLEMQKFFSPFYSAIAGKDENAMLTYSSSVSPEEDIYDKLVATRPRDMIIKHSTAGPHRDDLNLSLAGMPARRIASQGQSKTFTISMRLAQYCFLKASSGVRPILLLDDIFDKLDTKRVSHIIRLVSGPDFGQIFITDTNNTHISAMIDMATSLGGDSDNKVFKVCEGKFS